MTVINALPEHVAAITKIQNQCFSDPWPEEMIARLIHRFAVAVTDEGQVAGYLSLSTVLDEGSLDSIAVSPEYRRQGIGEALTADCIRRAGEESLSFVTLEVRAGNTSAIGLYEKLGFKSVGRRKNYYEKPREDAILMTLVMK